MEAGTGILGFFFFFVWEQTEDAGKKKKMGRWKSWELIHLLLKLTALHFTDSRLGSWEDFEIGKKEERRQRTKVESKEKEYTKMEIENSGKWTPGNILCILGVCWKRKGRLKPEEKKKKKGWDHFVISDLPPREYENPACRAETLRKTCGRCEDEQGRI